MNSHVAISGPLKVRDSAGVGRLFNEFEGYCELREIGGDIAELRHGDY